MKANVGTADQVIRVIIGIVLLSLILILDGGIRWIGWLGIVPIITALVKFCPLYTLLGIQTTQSKD